MVEIIAAVTDTNGKSRGRMAVKVYFVTDRPTTIEHDGDEYYHTGKVGRRFDTGERVFEMASDDDCRLWVNADASRVWED